MSDNENLPGTEIASRGTHNGIRGFYRVPLPAPPPLATPAIAQCCAIGYY